jgi:hypothetical protein
MFISMLLNLYMLYSCTYSAPSVKTSIVPKTKICPYECTDNFYWDTKYLLLACMSEVHLPMGVSMLPLLLLFCAHFYVY